MLNLFCFDELSIFSYCLGKVSSSDVAEDAKSFYSMFKDVSEMANLDVLKWLQARSKSASVVAYLLGIGNLENDMGCFQNSSEKLLCVSHAVEQIYMVRYPTLISPISFLLNVCTYAITGSKTVVDMQGNCSPSGHYKTITQSLKDQGTTEPQIPDGDLMNIFDNEQVTGRKHAIRPNNKGCTSIITNIGVVSLQCNNEKLQDQADLKPISILKVDDHDERNDSTKSNMTKLKEAAKEIIEQPSEEYEIMEKLHYEQLYLSVQAAIDAVKEEQIIGQVDENILDFIDSKIAQETTDELFIKCINCGTVNRKRKIVMVAKREKV